MHDTDDVLLMSYVDGEVDPDTARRVEAAMFSDPRLRARVRQMRETSSMVRAAFNHALYQHEDHAVPLPARGPRRAVWPAALAASLVAVALGAVIGVAVTRLPQDGPGAQALRDAALQRSLEARASGESHVWRDDSGTSRGRITPVSTYRNDAGRYCREFEEEGEAGGTLTREAGVACRGEDGRWRVRIRYYP